MFCKEERGARTLAVALKTKGGRGGAAFPKETGSRLVHYDGHTRLAGITACIYHHAIGSRRHTYRNLDVDLVDSDLARSSSGEQNRSRLVADRCCDIRH